MNNINIKHILIGLIVIVGIVFYPINALIGLPVGYAAYFLAFGGISLVIFIAVMLLIVKSVGVSLLLLNPYFLSGQEQLISDFFYDSSQIYTSIEYLLLDNLALSINVFFTMGFASLLTAALMLPDEAINIRKIKRVNSKAEKNKTEVKQQATDTNAEQQLDIGVLLGKKRGTDKNIFLTDKDANLHSFFIGTTGSGKTTAIANVIKSAIQRDKFLVMVDGKGDLEFAKQIKDYAIRQNKKFYLFSMLGESVKYNPLALGSYTAKKDRIVELREWTEEHYKKLAEGYLQLIFKVLKKANKEVDLFSLGQYLSTAKLYSLARELKDKELIAEIKEQENIEENVTSLKAEIQNFINSEIGHLFDTSNGEVLNLEQAKDEKAIIYFCLQPLAFPAYAKTLGKLIINDLKALAVEQLQQENRQGFYTIFDEFSVFAGQQVVNLINQGRGAGVHAILSTQSLSDLAINEGEYFIGQVLSNCNNYLIFRQNDSDDAERLAGVIGTKNAHEHTVQVNGDGATGRGTIKINKEYVIHPDDIKRLRLGEAVFVNKQNFKTCIVKINREVF